MDMPQNNTTQGTSTEQPVRSRDMIAGSTKTRALYSFFKWLSHTGYVRFGGRVFHSKPSRYAEVSYALDSLAGSPDASSSKSLLHLGSYNYSGLNNHPRILAAALDALQHYGTTTSGVRLLNGTTELHVRMERKLAGFLGFEDAVSFSSGFSANLAVLSSLISDQDIVLSDQLNHQSIVDGLKLSGAQIQQYEHRDCASLEGLLQGLSRLQRKFIVTDGIFSMDGDVAPLDHIVDLAEHYNAFIIVDDAHGTAGYGPKGRGTPAHFDVCEQVDVLTGSLSKGLPGIGGFAAGAKQTMDLLRFGSNSYLFSASLPPSTVAAIMAAIDVLEENPDIQDRLHEIEIRLRDGIAAMGLNIMHSESPIIPILLPNSDITFKFAGLLHDAGLYVNTVCFPAVSRKLPRLRLNASAALTTEDVDFALKCIEQAATELGLAGDSVDT